MATRPGRDTRKREQNDVRKRTDELVEMGIPHQMAVAVAAGKMELNDALQRLAFRDRVAKLEVKHELSRALATQIALGQASLDRVLARRRFLQYRDENLGRSVLEAARDDGRELTLLCHGQRSLRGTVSAVDAYQVVFAQVKGETEELHKLQIKLAYDAAEFKKVRKVLKWDKDLKNAPKDPVAAPQDRYGCSDKRLFRYLETEVEVQATLLEGEQLRGKVSWFSRFEFGLVVKGGVEVVVFRHALADLGET